MMYYLDTKGIYVTDMEDIRDIVTEDIYKAVEGLHNEEVKACKEDIAHYKEEYESYEYRLDNATTIAHEQQRIIEEVLIDLNSGKRINRQQILRTLQVLADLSTDIIDS